MEFTRPTDPATITAGEGTIIIPRETVDVPREVIDRFTRQLWDRRDLREEVELLTESDTEADYELDLEALFTLCWEHAQYAAAQGFSVSQLDVLRAIQSYDESRVMTKEIKESPWTEPYSDQTVQQALRQLTEVGLVAKEGHGVYRYTGPTRVAMAAGPDGE